MLDYVRSWRVRVWLFRSQARGDISMHSDIDIALLLQDEALPVDWLAGLRERLEQSNVLPRVDVVDLRHAGPDLRYQIEREGVLWNRELKTGN